VIGIADDGVRVLDGLGVDVGGKLMRLEVGTAGPIYQLGREKRTHNAKLSYRASRSGGEGFVRLLWMM
jgi:hypothetical protein